MEAKAQYLVSKEDLETVVCLFAFHEMSESPKKIISCYGMQVSL